MKKKKQKRKNKTKQKKQESSHGSRTLDRRMQIILKSYSNTKIKIKILELGMYIRADRITNPITQLDPIRPNSLKPIYIWFG